MFTFKYLFVSEMKHFKKIKEAPGLLLDLVYPRTCLICHDSLSVGESEICTNCLSGLPRAYFSHPRQNPVAELFWGRIPFVFSTSLLVYEKENSAMKIVHSIKYHGNKLLGIKMGQILGHELMKLEDFQDVDVLVPVPLHRRKEKKRGYNQSALIARGIALVTQKPIAVKAVERAVYNPSQTKKGRYERWINVADIFKVTDKHQLTGKHILLVDDVITTGATMEACAGILIKIQDCRISLCSLAFAP